MVDRSGERLEVRGEMKEVENLQRAEFPRLL